jgi:hypothetical protein
MASPMVASAAALYLCKYPGAADSNVWRCLIDNAYNDKFTGPPSQLPNYNWGYGKLSAFDALINCGPTGMPVVYSPVNTFSLSAYPNPYSVNTLITYNFSSIKSYSTASIVVFDMLGNMVKTINLNNSQGYVNMDRSKLAQGMYFYSLVVDGSRLKTAKLEVL